MIVRKPLPPSRLLAAIAALSLPLLTGCATSSMLGDWPSETFLEISGAHLRPDELGVEFRTRGYRDHDQLAWFKLRELREGPVKLPYVVGPENRPVWWNPEMRIYHPERVERLRGSPPEGATALPLGRGAPSLPPGANIAVFVPPKGEDLAHGSYGSHVAIVAIVCEDGRVYMLRPWLPCPSYRPWHRYPFVQLAIAFDVATFPLQLLAFWYIAP